jgi:hypothetical protein
LSSVASLVRAQVAATAKRLRAETCWNPAASGYSFDAASGYYFSTQTGLYYDPVSAGFFNNTTNKWYTYNGNEFLEMEVQKS